MVEADDERAEQGLTRTERRRLETRRQLLEAVRDLVVEHGVGGFVVADIAERADLAAGTFYNHFADREDAIVTAAGECIGRVRSEVQPLVAGVDCPLCMFIGSLVLTNARAVEDQHEAAFLARFMNSQLRPIAFIPGDWYAMLEQAVADGIVTCDPARVSLAHRMALSQGDAALVAGVAGERPPVSLLVRSIGAMLGEVLDVDRATMDEIVERTLVAIAASVD